MTALEHVESSAYVRSRLLRGALLVAGLAFCISYAATSEARLLSQQVRGAYRICTYEGPAGNLLRPEDLPSMKVGRGEPCPVRPQREERPNPPVPVMATFSGEAYIQGDRYCYYSYLGQRYARRIDSLERCPFTPHFFE